MKAYPTGPVGLQAKELCLPPALAHLITLVDKDCPGCFVGQHKSVGSVQQGGKQLAEVCNGLAVLLPSCLVVISPGI